MLHRLGPAEPCYQIESIAANSYLIRTESGLYRQNGVQSRERQNTSWKSKTKDIAFFRDGVYAATDEGLFYWAGLSWVRDADFDRAALTKDVRGLARIEDALLAFTPTGVCSRVGRTWRKANDKDLTDGHVATIGRRLFLTQNATLFCLEGGGELAQCGRLPGIIDALGRRGGSLLGAENPARELGTPSLWAANQSNDQWTRLLADGLSGFVNDLYSPSDSDRIIIVATSVGLFWTNDSGTKFTRGSLPSGLNSIGTVYAIQAAADRTLLVGTSTGLWSVQDSVPRPSVFERLLSFGDLIWKRSEKHWWFRPALYVASVLATIVTGLISLLLLIRRRGPTVLSRTFLRHRVKPLLEAIPGFGRSLLLLGYTNRILALPRIADAGKQYFGLPVEVTLGVDEGGDPRKAAPVLPDQNGDALHRRMADSLSTRKPLIVVGQGGAGKTTVLARWAWLTANGILDQLAGFVPVLVRADMYEGNLLKAIAYSMEQVGVPMDEDVVRAQLETGRYLILFDGVSEVSGDKRGCWNDLVRSATESDFERCYFVFATRPMDEMPREYPVYELEPLRAEVISVLLPYYNLGPEAEKQSRRQLQYFGQRPIQPLLFRMIIAQANDTEIKVSRAKLFESYFRRLLQVSNDSNRWSGWSLALETLADFTCLSTASRGAGLPIPSLVDRITSKRDEKTLLDRLREYDLNFSKATELLTAIERSGLAERSRKWRFAHERFEEYFAASRLVSMVETGEEVDLSPWSVSEEQANGLLVILEIAHEIGGSDFLEAMLKQKLRPLWRSFLIARASDFSGAPAESTGFAANAESLIQ